MFSLVVFLPLFSSFCTGFYGHRLGIKGTAVVTLLSLGTAVFFAWSCFLTHGLSTDPIYIDLFSWIESGLFSVNWLLCIDSLAISMFILVTTVSSLVYLYSLSYMLEDPHLIRFSCYISLFTFFMLILVTSGNFVQLFFGWEGVGICSYLLINFWYTRLQANKAAIQALVVNKIGDIGVILAIAGIFALCQAVDFETVFFLVPYLYTQTFCFFLYDINFISLIGFFLFIGAVGKSAQLGLHTWLPSAMEGPTPVSALIHAATMVTAGIFLIIRCSPLFEYTETILVLITIVGSLTVFFAATVGMLQNDIKRVIAYSTCSQLGYMAFSCGLSNYAVAFFHLINHGFFKALLFLSAGSIIHGLSDEQDLRKMGSLVKFFPVTYCMFLIGSLALMGFPFLSGFYSKDVILETAFAQYTIVSLFAYWLGTVSAFFTAFYSFRLLYLAFFAPINASKSVVLHAHESSNFILIPLLILSFGSLFSGFLLKDLFIGVGSTYFSSSIFILPQHFNLFEAEFLPTFIKLIPLFFSLGGALLALILNTYCKSFLVFLKFSKAGQSLYWFLNQKWFFDKIYNFYIVKPMFNFSYTVPFSLLDKGFIELLGPLGLSTLLNTISKKVSYFQTGLIYHYTLVMLVGVIGFFNIVFLYNNITLIFSLDMLYYYFFLIFLIA